MQISAPPSCSQVLVSLCSSSWETVLLSTKLINIFTCGTGLRLKISWAPWKQIQNKSKSKQSPLSLLFQEERSASRQSHSDASQLCCFTVQLPWPGPIHRVEEWALEDVTPRLCRYLVEHSLQPGSALFQEERVLNQYCWPDSMSESPHWREMSPSSEGRGVVSHMMLFCERSKLKHNEQVFQIQLRGVN